MLTSPLHAGRHLRNAGMDILLAMTPSARESAVAPTQPPPPATPDGAATTMPQPLMALEAYAAVAVVLFLIGFIGFFCNLVVIVLYIRDRQLWTPLNGILLNLVASDFSVSVLGNPWTFTAAIVRSWIFGRTMCVAYGFFMALLGISSITTLAVLAFERYIVISRPWSGGALSRRGAGVLLLGIWTYAFTLTSPPLFGWGQYTNEAANISCSVNWEKKTFNSTSYIVFLFAFGLVVPVLVITFSYVNILRTMKRTAIQTGSVNRAEGRVALMVGVMISAFLIAWTPYAALALLVAFGDASLVTPAMAVVPSVFAKSSICYNPFIYVALNTQFRAAWRRMMGRPQSHKTGGATFQTSAGAVTCMPSPALSCPQAGEPLFSNVATAEATPNTAPSTPMPKRSSDPVSNRFFLQVLVKMTRPSNCLDRLARQLHLTGGNQTCCSNADERRSISSHGSSAEVVEVEVRVPVRMEGKSGNRNCYQAEEQCSEASVEDVL